MQRVSGVLKVNHDWIQTRALKRSSGNISSRKPSSRGYPRQSLHGQVVHELGRRIVGGEIGAGVVLPNEAELGASFDISRTALREGIKVLTAKGLLASRTRTGTWVRPRCEWNMLDPDVLAWRLGGEQTAGFCRDLIEFRLAVEPQAASLAARRADRQDVLSLEQALQDMLEAGEHTFAAIEPALRFHQGILLASGNEILASLGALVETALMMDFQLVSTLQKPLTVTGAADAFARQISVLKAIKARHPDRARDAMTAVLTA